MVVVNPYKTLIIGIQDLDSIPIGATLRVKQHVNTIPKSLYRNVGNPVNWNSRGTISKILQAIRFLRPLREPFCAYHFSNRKANELIRFLQQNQFERIILSEIWTFPYLYIVKRYGKGAEIIFDFHNVESKLQETEGTGFYQSWRGNRIRCMERIIVEEAKIWVCSERDREQYHILYNVDAEVVPNAINVNGQFLKKLTTDKNLGYVGCFNYPPNEEAAMFLMEKIAPRLDFCGVRFIGKYPTDKMCLYSNPKDFFTNEVKEIKPELEKVRTLALPIFNGSGTRFKVLEGMTYGVPIVATLKAVEGLEVIPGIHYLRAEDEIEFELKIRWLWNNPSEEERIRQNARELVEEKYSWNYLKKLNV